MAPAFLGMWTPLLFAGFEVGNALFESRCIGLFHFTLFDCLFGGRDTLLRLA
jgi:hypothetical protein